MKNFDGKYIPMEYSKKIGELGLKVKSTHWFNPNGVLLEKWIDIDEETAVTVTGLIEYYDSCIADKIDAVTFDEAEYFFQTKYNAYSVPKPIMGSKNGYDSYPILGWSYDLFVTNKDTDNSYYMGYPIGYWFTATEDVVDDINDPEDKLSDYIDEPLSYIQAKLEGIKAMIRYAEGFENKKIK